MTLTSSYRIVVITVPERLNQPWIEALAGEADVERVDRAAALQPGIELVQQTRPDIVIIDRDIEQTEQGIRQIFTKLPSTICIAVLNQSDTATIRRLVAAGARDVLVAPFDDADLIASIRAVMETEADRRAYALVPVGGAHHHGQLIVVASPKGGSGKTVIATNIAVALRQISASRVILVDCCLQFGDVGVQLNLWSRHTMYDLIQRIDDLDDSMLAPVIQQHSSGLHVMLGPSRPEEAGEVTGDHMTLLMDCLLERYDYVVVDTWSFFDETVETLMRRADKLLAIATPEVPSLKNVKRYLEFAQAQTSVHGQVTLVLNRFPSVDGIALDDVRQHLRFQVGATIPSDGRLMTQSVNSGVPVVISNPQSWIGQSFIRLAAYLAGERVSTVSLSPEQMKGKIKMAGGGDKSGLFRFIRREVN